jgi:2,5-diketo-D-gluconate reductase B
MSRDDAPPDADGMPMLGLGTYGIEDADEIERALELGYRHLDTALAYGNEDVVGAAIDEADVDDRELFVATKLPGSELDYGAAVQAANESHARLGVDRIDLLYVHWPRGDYDPEDTMAALDQLVDDGVAWRIGVSNFTADLLRAAEAETVTGVFANQVELHPLLPQPALREACAEHDVAVVAYAPLARGAVFDVPEIQAVAERHDATPAQVSLAWLREKGVTAIPKATGDHQTENWGSLGVDLDADDVARIDAIDRRHRCVDPADAPWNA